ncbi:tetraspanin 42Ep [Haematobia irritans]|uniref:tetraspanin 42Ep n=1 Tax=Haematobia irritans TaxID=7368 RepID=UPI003F507E57
MGALFNTVKGFVFGFNIICVIIGLATLVIDVLGIKNSTPGTDSHACFILGMLLCGLLVMTAVVGCYGICSEVLGVNVIYSIFMLSLLILQCLQLRSFQPHGIYFHSLQELEVAWRNVGTDPKAMDNIQMQLKCCGLFNAQDYAYKHLPIPSSCYSKDNDIAQFNQSGCLEVQWKSHAIMTRRQQMFNWALLIAESLTLFYAFVLCILIWRRQNRIDHHRDGQNDAVGRAIVQQNNIGSRYPLL